MRTRLVVLAAAVVAIVACDATTVSPSPTAVEPTAPPPSVETGFAVVSGPWRPAPVSVEPDLVTAIESVCRNPADPDLKAAIQDVPVALVDARGDSLVSILLADETAAFECRVKVETLGGELAATVLQPPTRLVPDATGPVEPETIRVVSHNRVDEETGSRTILIGRVGSGAARVLAGFPDESEVEASMADGWYYAWWPGAEEPNSIAAVDRRSIAIDGIDAPQTEVEGRAKPAAWWLDPAAGPLDPTTTTIPALIQEQECASGRSLEGQVLDPVVFLSPDALLVNVWIRVPPGNAWDCQSNPVFSTKIGLPEPLGQRQLLDGSEVPPRDATGPPG